MNHTPACREYVSLILTVIIVNKKIFSIIAIVLTVMAAGFAGSVTVNMGTIQEFQIPVGSSELRQADVIDVTNWAAGPEIRISTSFLSLDAYMITRQGEIIDVVDGGEAVFADDIQQHLFGMASLSLTTKVAEFTTLSVGAGPAYGINLFTGWSPHFWLFNENTPLDTSTFKHILESFSLSYRARLDFSFSRFSYGISYSVSSFGSEDPYTPDWKNGKLALTFITRVL